MSPVITVMINLTVAGIAARLVMLVRVVIVTIPATTAVKRDATDNQDDY